MKKEAEFAIQDLIPLAIVFVVVTIVLSYGATIVGNVRSQQTANSTEYNISGQGLTSLNTFGTNLPMLATIVIAAVIISVLVVYMGGRLMR